MRHCLIYHGGFERNFPTLKAGATTFEGTDGTEHPLPPFRPRSTACASATWRSRERSSRPCVSNRARTTSF